MRSRSQDGVAVRENLGRALHHRYVIIARKTGHNEMAPQKAKYVCSVSTTVYRSVGEGRGWQYR